MLEYAYIKTPKKDMLLMDILNNFALWAALSVILFAQVIKIPIQLIVTKKLNIGLAFSTGGMPSSHSAAVAALTTVLELLRASHRLHLQFLLLLVLLLCLMHLVYVVMLENMPLF